MDIMRSSARRQRRREFFLVAAEPDIRRVCRDTRTRPLRATSSSENLVLVDRRTYFVGLLRRPFRLVRTSLHFPCRVLSLSTVEANSSRISSFFDPSSSASCLAYLFRWPDQTREAK